MMQKAPLPPDMQKTTSINRDRNLTKTAPPLKESHAIRNLALQATHKQQITTQWPNKELERANQQKHFPNFDYSQEFEDVAQENKGKEHNTNTIITTPSIPSFQARQTQRSKPETPTPQRQMPLYISNKSTVSRSLHKNTGTNTKCTSGPTQQRTANRYRSTKLPTGATPLTLGTELQSGNGTEILLPQHKPQPPRLRDYHLTFTKHRSNGERGGGLLTNIYNSIAEATDINITTMEEPPQLEYQGVQNLVSSVEISNAHNKDWGSTHRDIRCERFEKFARGTRLIILNTGTQPAYALQMDGSLT
ncbi:hypothetical protein CHS0354_024583 [Potamilus streckersoni]|uniref:Uncharacterized protein n=1 Tax=Potamilus streckersoni TaxID=2493646 RepID=A0AAE0SGA9_9BIVA|nr:hypothetical protein CHS0354_024583 [Potamilus streckersoni]